MTLAKILKAEHDNMITVLQEVGTLKPCPFCGKHDIFIGWTSAMTAGLKCKACGIEMNKCLPRELPNIPDTSYNGVYKHMLVNAARRWNMRDGKIKKEVK